MRWTFKRREEVSSMGMNDLVIKIEELKQDAVAEKDRRAQWAEQYKRKLDDLKGHKAIPGVDDPEL